MAVVVSLRHRSWPEVSVPEASTQIGTLQNKHILLGVSGGIAAYKAPALVRLLRKAGADVQVVTTRSAAQFVTATTLQAVSGQPVRSNLWDAEAEAAMGHIELARWADVILVAPATADLLSRLAHGRADARRLVAHAEAQSVVTVGEALQEFGVNPTSYLVGIKYIEAMTDIACQATTRVLYMPFETDVVGAVSELNPAAQ